MERHGRLASFLALLGAVLWIGALSPEIFISSGEGCIVDEDGNAVDRDEARSFMEKYFFGTDDADVEVEFKFKFLELLKGV